MMRIMEKRYRYKPSRLFCFPWMVFTCLHSCLQACSLPFLPVLLYFSLVSFQFLSKSIEFRPIIVIVFHHFLVLIVWSVEKSHDRHSQKNVAEFYVCFSPNFIEPIFPQILPFGPGWKLKTFSICSRCLDLEQPMWQF